MMISTRFRHFILSTSHSTMLTSFRYELLTNQRFQYLILALLIITLICIILLFSSHQFELFFICGMIMLAIYCITFNMKMYGNDNESVLLSYVFFDKSNVSHEPKPIMKPNSKGINENKDRQIKYLDNMSSLFRSKEKADDSYNSFIDTLKKSKIGLETSYNKFKDLYEQFGKENDKIKDELLAVDISMAVYDYELNRLGKAIEERFTILGEDSNIKGSMLTDNTDTNEMEDSSGQEKNNLDDLVSACMDKTQDLYQLTGCEKKKSKQKQIEIEQPDEPPVVLIEPRPVGNPKNRSYSDKHRKPKNDTEIVDKDSTPVIDSKKSKEEIELDSQASHKLAIEKENMKLKTLHRLIASFVRESVFDTGKHLHNLFSHYTSHKKDKYHESEKERVKTQDDAENQRDKLAKKDQNTEPELQDRITRKKRSQINRIDAIDKSVENIDDFTQPEHMLYNVQIIFIVEGFYALIVLLLYLSNYIYIGMTVRAIFLACVMTDIVIAILLMLEAELLEMKCSSGDIDSCKTRKELAAKEVITKLNEFTKLPKNSADLKSIKSELGSIANKFETRNKKLQKYIAILADTTIIKIIETFDYLFKKLEFIEKDFEDIMQHKVSRSEYYTSIKKMKILLDNIESKVDDVKMSEVVELYADNVKINISYEREKDGIEDAMNTFMSEDAKDINKKNEDKCKHDVDKICKLGDKVDQLYFTLLVVSVILMICICV